MTKIAVFGAGTWGIALARLLAVHGKDVTVWSAIPAELKALSTCLLYTSPSPRD